MSTKLKDLIPYDQIMMRTKKTLSDYKFGIAIFDNSQMFTKLKYQRDGKLSSSTIVTSRCFIEPWIPLDLDDLVYHTLNIKMTYINQVIPSPLKLPAFKNIDPLHPTSYMELATNPDPADATGARVNSYAEMATIALTVSKFRSMIPRDNMPFKFMNPVHQHTMDKLELASRLKLNQRVIVPAFGENFFTGM
eukprot:5442444-Ditylum_brightwellii.AAC.1